MQKESRKRPLENSAELDDAGLKKPNVGETTAPGDESTGYDPTASVGYAAPVYDQLSAEHIATNQMYSQTYELKTDPSIITLRVLLGHKSIGCIIGKQGAQINQFRADTGANIGVDKQVTGATKRVVTVKGNVDQIIAVLCAMSDKLANRQKTGKEGVSAPGDTTDVRHAMTLLVHNYYVGNIMGKSGSKIATIRQSTGASIKISDKTLDESTEKTITIQGSAEEVNKAINAICVQIVEAQTSALETGRTVSAHIPYVPKPDTIVQSPLMIASQLQQYASAYPQAPGSQLVQQFAQQFAQQAAATQTPYADPYAMGGSQQTLVIPVPDSMVGSVIGRGGNMISSIRQRSGATIKISDSKKNVGGSTGERQVTITGTKHQNEVAVALIYEILNGSGTTTDTTSARMPTSASYAAYASQPNLGGSLGGLSSLGGALGTGPLTAAGYGTIGAIGTTPASATGYGPFSFI